MFYQIIAAGVAFVVTDLLIGKKKEEKDEPAKIVDQAKSGHTKIVDEPVSPEPVENQLDNVPDVGDEEKSEF